MEQQGEGYLWVGSDRECVYFARCFNVQIWGKPHTVPNDRRRYKNERMSWKPFETMFDKVNFAQEWIKIEREECDYPSVDKIFR